MMFGARDLPGFQVFTSLSPLQQRLWIEDSLGLFVDSLQVQGRDPDNQESGCFRKALAALQRNDMAAALAMAQLLSGKQPAIDPSEIPRRDKPVNRVELAHLLRQTIERRKEGHSVYS